MLLYTLGILNHADQLTKLTHNHIKHDEVYRYKIVCSRDQLFIQTTVIAFFGIFSKMLLSIS